jgi:hypothetical protein
VSAGVGFFGRIGRRDFSGKRSRIKTTALLFRLEKQKHAPFGKLKLA